MSYSQYFNFGSDPTIQKVKAGYTGYQSGRRFTSGNRQLYRDKVTAGRADEEANEAFDLIMAGHDATTAQYTNTLKSIYDGYGKYAEDYDGQIQPLIESLTGDIANMEGYIENYNDILIQNKDTFLNGIVLDPNANRTRAEYTGAVADQFDNARKTAKHRMTSQGLNPYENKGAEREHALERAQSLGSAERQAYTDWRESYNRDKERQQNATGKFIDMQGRAIEGQGSIIDARRSIGGFYGDVMNAKIGADKERASGYENLASLSEARRQEALGLGQQQQENARYKADITQQLSAKLKNGGSRYTNRNG